MKKLTASFLVATAIMVVACASAAPDSDTLGGREGSTLTGNGLEGLTALASLTSRPDIQDLEALFGAKASLVLDTGVVVEYEIRGPEQAWFAKARVLVRREASRTWLQTIEVRPRNPCIPESQLASMWAGRAGIPITKSWDTKDTPKGWVRRHIPHMIGAINWVHSPTPDRTISYFLQGVDREACASGFSFSFSR